jgi:hypothetical protein
VIANWSLEDVLVEASDGRCVCCPVADYSVSCIACGSVSGEDDLKGPRPLLVEPRGAEQQVILHAEVSHDAD